MAEATVFVEQNSPMALLRQAGVLIGIAAAVALGGWVVMWSREPHFSMLYSDLSDRDMTQIADTLKSTQIPYRIDPDSGALMVQTDKADDVKLRLAEAGLPKGGQRGSDILNDAQPFNTSQAMEKARLQYAVEEELGRSIARIDNVRAARVHLALPAESVFARQRKPPSASVMVDLYAGRAIDPAQVAAITHLVSASVPNLPASRVTVVDSRGNLLTDAKRDKLMTLTTQRFDYKRKVEEAYIDDIRELLEPLVGADGLRVQVAADIDFTEVEKTSEKFNPDLPVKRSERTSQEERTGGGPGGVPGALSNSPPDAAAAPEQTAASDPAAAGGAPAPAAAAPTGSKRTQSTINYEIDREVAHTKPSVGEVRRVSVAVVLRKPQPPAPAAPAADPNAAADPKADPAAAAAATAAVAPVEFTAEELANMTQLVKDSVGFQAARGDTVTLMPATFIEPVAPEPLPPLPIWKQPWVWDIGKQALGGLFVLILFFGLLRPAIKSLTAKPAVATVDSVRGADALPLGPNGEQLALPNGSRDGRSLPAPQSDGSQGDASLDLNDNDPVNLEKIREAVMRDGGKKAAQIVRQQVNGDS